MMPSFLAHFRSQLHCIMSKDNCLSFVCFGKGSLAFQNGAPNFKSIEKRENRKLLGTVIQYGNVIQVGQNHTSVTELKHYKE